MRKAKSGRSKRFRKLMFTPVPYKSAPPTSPLLLEKEEEENASAPSSAQTSTKEKKSHVSLLQSRKPGFDFDGPIRRRITPTLNITQPRTWT
jgi:hypothetical protein